MALKPIQILINAKDNASAVFTSLQAKVVAVGAAIASYFGVQAFAGVVSGAADFESAMSRVKAATGASKDEMAQLTKASQDAAASSQYTSIETAGALENLAKAGLSVQDSIGALPNVLALASAGDITLSESSEIVTKAVMGMGLQFSETARVADVLALGANATNTSVSGLAEALSYAAPNAQALGVSLESTVAMMGKLADGGIDASRAGTGLANIMAQFSDPASKFRLALADAGITTTDFEKALHQLADAGPRGEKAILAVGLNAGPALRSLLNQGMPALDELTQKLRNAEGSAAAAAKVMQDNLKGSLTGLGSVWQTVKDVFATPVLPVIRKHVDELTAALRGALSDGTVQRFGETFATAFQNAMKWVREFVASVDFPAVLAKMQAWADQTAAAMTRLGEWATSTGNAVALAYNVMTAGANGVLTAIYGIGSVFAEVAAAVMTGVAKLREGLASVTFGQLSESFKLAAEDARNAAQGFDDAAQAMRDKAAESLNDMADRAQGARDAYVGLVSGMGAAGEQASTTSRALATVASELQKTAEATAAANAAQRKKAQADADAKTAAEQHAQAIADMRAEYARLIESGDTQAAAKKIQEINDALRGTKAASKDATAAAQEAAKQVEAAFARLGVTSTQVLKEQAASTKRDFETIRNSGLATAEDIQNAFKVAAEAAIAANKGVAPSWVQAEAAIRGYVIETDAAGKSTIRLREAIGNAASASGEAASAMRGHWGSVRESINQASDAVREYNQRMKEKYGRPGEGNKPEDEAGGGSGGRGGRGGSNQPSTQWVWTRAAIIEYLEQAGLDKLLAEDLAKQFVQPDGSVNYLASDAQKRWGGKNSTLAEALGKMVDFYKYGEGKFEANQRTQFLQRQQGGGGTSPQPVPPPGPGAPPPAPTQGRQSGMSTQSAPISITINANGVNDPVKLARMLEPELAKLARLAR